MKTLMLEGAALEKAKEYDAFIDKTNKEIKELMGQMEAIRTAANQHLDGVVKEMKKLCGVTEDTPVQMDVSYLQAHGVAFMQIQQPTNLAEMLFGTGGEDTRTIQ